uniref:Uncharacterized protein n=1 Tax=Romanomermis culicivorax TaxID=13658 RepID=A0A915L691_ROMCU
MCTVDDVTAENESIGGLKASQTNIQTMYTYLKGPLSVYVLATFKTSVVGGSGGPGATKTTDDESLSLATTASEMGGSKELTL